MVFVAAVVGGGIVEGTVKERQQALSFEEFFFGFMRYAQECHGIKDFPLFPGPTWQQFIYTVAMELEGELPEPFDVKFRRTPSGPLLDEKSRRDISSALEYTATVDHSAHRMTLDIESVWGKELGRYFPQLAEHIFEVALEIRGFINVG
jgi:hypothetical protein